MEGRKEGKNMVLNVDVNFEEKEDNSDIIIEFNGKREIISPFNSTKTSIPFYDAGEYEIVLSQKKATKNIPIYMYLVYLVTFVFQGIFSILFFNVDRNWEKKIAPFRVYSKFKVYLKSDTNLSFNYSGAEYDDNTSKWSKPIFTPVTNDIEGFSVEFEENKYDFKRQFFLYAKKISSIWTVILIIIGILMYKVIDMGFTIGIMILSVVAVILAIMFIYMLFREKKKYIKLYNEYISEEKCC